MKATYWHQKWAAGDIGFHEAQANRLLVENIHHLNLSKGSRIFLPLCGKTRDIHWLMDQGFQIAGAELSETAIRDLFTDLQLTPTIQELGNLKHFSAENIDIFVGDIFELSQATLGKVDAIYDRAALVALPDTMRQAYSEHLIKLCKNAPQLVITFEYDQRQMQGPPFSIGLSLMQQYYQQHYRIDGLATRDDILLKGKTNAKEHAWLLNYGRDRKNMPKRISKQFSSRV